MDSIIQFAQINFDWDVSKTKNTLAAVLKKVSERTVSFFNYQKYFFFLIFSTYIHIYEMVFKTNNVINYKN